MTDYSQDPICGRCGFKKSHHVTYRDVVLCPVFGKSEPESYKTDPTPIILVDWLSGTEPNLLNELRRRWQIQHVHPVAVNEQKESDTCQSTESPAKSTDAASLSM